MQTRKTLNSQNNLEKEERAEGIMLPDFRLYYKALVIKIWYQHRNKYKDQWNKIESPEINPHMYGQLIYNKRGKNMQWKRVSSEGRGGKTGRLHVKE